MTADYSMGMRIAPIALGEFGRSLKKGVSTFGLFVRLSFHGIEHYAAAWSQSKAAVRIRPDPVQEVTSRKLCGRSLK